MKHEDVEHLLNRLETPELERVIAPRELKIPLLSYKKSSKAGLWLLLLPATFAFSLFLKMAIGVKTEYVDFVRKFFASIDDNAILTYLIPVIFIGLPLVSIVI